MCHLPPRIKHLWLVYIYIKFSKHTCHRKGLVQYNPLYGRTDMKKHYVHEHFAKLMKYKGVWRNLKMWILQVNKEEEDNCIIITKNNLRRNCRKKGGHAQLRSIEDSVLYIGKGFIGMFNVELTWFHHLVMNRDNKMRFPRWRQLMEEHILPMLQKTMDAYVLPTMSICVIQQF